MDEFWILPDLHNIRRPVPEGRSWSTNSHHSLVETPPQLYRIHVARHAKSVVRLPKQ